MSKCTISIIYIVTVYLISVTMETQMQLTSLLPLLDSSDLATVKQIKELVIEQLDSCK